MERPKITDFIKETIANPSIELMYLKDYVKELESYADKQEEAISVTHCCKPKGTVKTIDFDKAKEFMINYMNVDRETKNVVSMAYYTKRVTVKEFFEIMENAFKKALK